MISICTPGGGFASIACIQITRCTTMCCDLNCGASEGPDADHLGRPLGPPSSPHIPVDRLPGRSLPCRGRLPGSSPSIGGVVLVFFLCSISWMRWSLCHAALNRSESTDERRWGSERNRVVVHR